MPYFDIIRKSDVEQTFRVSKVMADFDVKTEHSNEHFKGEIVLPEEWSIGLIVGGSGTGKSTIARELFGITDIKEYTHRSVIDDMPAYLPVNEITRMFYSVGFGSVPSWLKPYHVLSNGEKMRVDLARSLLSDQIIVFDEFTSVVDRQVAQTSCIAVQKAIRKSNKKFIAISCHSDIIPWLNPDWIFSTDEMKMVFTMAHSSTKNTNAVNAAKMNGQNLGVIII